jgi:hypothetical protein
MGWMWGIGVDVGLWGVDVNQCESYKSTEGKKGEVRLVLVFTRSDHLPGNKGDLY